MSILTPTFVTKTTAYTAKNGECVLADATAAAFAVTLPTAAWGLAPVRVKKTDASANAVTVTRAGTATIDGATTFVLSARYDLVELVCDGVNWHVVAKVASAAAASGALTRISQTVLAAPAATISFAAIAATYEDLLISVVGRGTAAGATTPMLCRFNADTGGNYAWQRLYGNAVAAGALQGGSQTAIHIGQILAAAGQAGEASVVQIVVAGYARTAFEKTALANDYCDADGGSGSVVDQYGGVWRNAAAITQLDLSLVSGNFETGTVATLYGRL